MATKAKSSSRSNAKSKSKKSTRGHSRTAARSEPARPRSSSKSKRETAKKSPRAARTNPDDRRFLTKFKKKLSPSTQRAKWIGSPEDHEDRPGQTLATRNPEVIRSWAEARGGVPATIMTASPDRPTVLRFDFPGFSKGKLQQIEWDAWLDTFKDRNLVFVFQEHMKAGNDSNFFKLDNPEREDG